MVAQRLAKTDRNASRTSPTDEAGIDLMAAVSELGRTMKCVNCGGRLDQSLSLCPYCGVRQEVDLRQIHFRDLGADPGMPCPRCAVPLELCEVGEDAKTMIERCPSCHGTFFNPGELEAVLESTTAPLIWLDDARLQRLAGDFANFEEVVYLRCPTCREHMSRINFGGESGIIIDRCGTHGVWLDGAELRRISEWWSAGGKFLHQKNEAARASRRQAMREVPRARMAGSVEPWTDHRDGGWDFNPDNPLKDIRLWAILAGVALKFLLR
jgi:Zn-finger nucleic acid-binding protein